MEPSNFFLRTKLLPPRSIPGVLERPRLIERLSNGVSSTLTLVAADAGCGKTTLVADFVRSQQRPVAWYQLDHTDADPAVFMGYLTMAVADIVPGFGDVLMRYLEGAGSELAQFPERSVDLFINEVIERVDQPFIIVLDDYHHIGTDTAVHRLVDRLLQYASDLFHVIITTRDLPPLAIMRRRTRADAAILRREDLLFTDDEVKELFQSTLDLTLKDDELAAYRERTHGWITALQLIRQVAEREIYSGISPAPLDLVAVLQQSEKDVFDYFAEEVIARETPDVEDTLLRLSLLESLPLELCSGLFPDLRCSKMLPELARKNVFLIPVGDGAAVEEYRFHPLFRDFLRRRFRSKFGTAAVATERLRLAEHFLDDGKWDTALPFLIDAGEVDRAAAIFAERGGDLIAFGAFVTVTMLASRIPQASLEAHPRSLLHLAEVSRQQGDVDRSESVLRRAATLLEAADDLPGFAEALHSLASLARRRGDRDAALELLERSESLAEPGSETLLKCANTRGLCLVAAGSWAEAEQNFRVALNLAEQLGSEHYIRLVAHNLALAPGFRGDFAEALRWFRRIFREGEPDSQLPQEAIGHLNVARLHIYRGEFTEAETHLNRSQELCSLYNLRSLKGEILEAFANLYRDRGELSRADEYYRRAIHAYEDANIDIRSRELIEEQARYYKLSGDLKRSRSLLENLAESRKASGVETPTVELALCELELAERKLDGLSDRVEAIRNGFAARGDHYYELLASMLLAETYFADGREHLAAEPTRRVLDLAARFDYEYWLRQRIGQRPEIFRLEEIYENLPLDLRECVQAAASAPVQTAKTSADAPKEITAEPADLTVNVLGPVGIFRDPALPLAPDAWTTRRARDIFCFIATARNRRIAKDVLIDTFWPEDPPEVVEKNFHPTISHIRKALNSRQAFKQNFLVFRDGAYQLDPNLTYSIDTEIFEQVVADAEKFKRTKDFAALRNALEQARTLYRGDFMEGVYDDWAEERRQFFQEQYLRVIGALAKLALAEKRYAETLRLTEQILAIDPYREDVHRSALKAIAGQGKPAALKKHYDSMADLLKKDLGIEPSAETRKVYSSLTK